MEAANRWLFRRIVSGETNIKGYICSAATEMFDRSIYAIRYNSIRKGSSLRLTRLMTAVRSTDPSEEISASNFRHAQTQTSEPFSWQHGQAKKSDFANADKETRHSHFETGL